jgi:hypothetical protein
VDMTDISPEDEAVEEETRRFHNDVYQMQQRQQLRFSARRTTADEFEIEGRQVTEAALIELFDQLRCASGFLPDRLRQWPQYSKHPVSEFVDYNLHLERFVLPPDQLIVPPRLRLARAFVVAALVACSTGARAIAVDYTCVSVCDALTLVTTLTFSATDTRFLLFARIIGYYVLNNAILALHKGRSVLSALY